MVKKRRKKVNKKERIFDIFCNSVVLVLTLLVLYPVIYVVSCSFSAPEAVSSGRVWLFPVDFSLAAYRAILKYDAIWSGYKNTIIYTVVGTMINIAMTMVCAYPLSRKNLYGRKTIMLLFTFTMLFSSGMIPGYILITKLHMINTIWALVLPGAMSVYNMIVARTFLENNISNELLEAAKIDGCNDFYYFFKMVLPLSKTIIAVLALWYAVGHWNAYFGAFLYLNDSSKYPLQIILREILVNNEVSGEVLDLELEAQMQALKTLLKYAVIVVSTAPLMFFYPFAQKYFVKGVMIGSVKG